MVSDVTAIPDDVIHKDNVWHDQKVPRYLHNLVRICTFCRLRLFDPTISGHPLTLMEWRTALWGDYRIHTEIPKASNQATQARVKCKYEEKNGVSRLFGNAAALSSYQLTHVEMLGLLEVMAEVAVRDTRVHLLLLWEAHEANFRCELMALDAIVVPQDGWPIINMWAREAQVSGVWGKHASLASVIPPVPSKSSETAWRSSSDPMWKESIPFLRRFLDVMLRWPDYPDYLKDMRCKVDSWSSEDYDIIQHEAASLYMCTFVSRFHRLPICPVSYPSEAIL